MGSDMGMDLPSSFSQSPETADVEQVPWTNIDKSQLKGTASPLKSKILDNNSFFIRLKLIFSSKFYYYLFFMVSYYSLISVKSITFSYS